MGAQGPDLKKKTKKNKKKALDSLLVALTALQSLQQSGGLSHLLQLVLHHLRPASDSVADDEESQPSLDDDMEEVQFAGAVSTSDPYNYRQAIQADDSERWKEATLAEYNTLLQNGTWEIVDLPPGEKAIGSSWVFWIKRHSDGSIERYRAQIVAQGCSQRPGRDYL